MNEPLKKPKKTTARLIFQSVTNILTQGEDFIPTWDTTDHLNFVCAECHAKATILAVEFYPNINAVGAALYFRLKCPNCKNTGQRKIYLETKDAPFQQALNYKNQLLLYTRHKQKPVKTIQLKQENMSK